MLLVWALSIYADERPSGVPSEASWVKVDRVTNGDHRANGSHTRPLTQLDASERDQSGGLIAATALEHMVAHSVYLVRVDEARYCRLVG